jgi:hypothetical protein
LEEFVLITIYYLSGSLNFFKKTHRDHQHQLQIIPALFFGPFYRHQAILLSPGFLKDTVLFQAHYEKLPRYQYFD